MQAPDPSSFFSVPQGALTQNVVVLPAQRNLDPGSPVISPGLSVVTPVESAPQTFVAGWTAEQARPVEVALLCEYPSQGQGFGAPTGWPPNAAIAFAGGRDGMGNAGLQDSFLNGFFKIEYGAGALVRTRYVDMVNARIFLGTCTNVRVLAYRWQGPTPYTIGTFALAVGASIAEASGAGSYDELQYTVQKTTFLGSSVDEYYTPPQGAYAWESGVARFQDRNPSLWGSAETDVSFANNTEMQLYRFANYQLIPTYRRFKADGGPVRALSTGVVATGIGLITTVRWYLNS